MSDIDLELNGKSCTLRFTVRAIKSVNKYFGSFSNCYNRLVAFDFSAYVAVVAAGLNKSIDEVEEDVALTGLHKLAEPVSKYVDLLSNGGQPTVPVGDAKPGE